MAEREKLLNVINEPTDGAQIEKDRSDTSSNIVRLLIHLSKSTRPIINHRWAGRARASSRRQLKAVFSSGVDSTGFRNPVFGCRPACRVADVFAVVRKLATDQRGATAAAGRLLSRENGGDR